MPNFDVRAFTVQLVRATDNDGGAADTITVGDGHNAPNDDQDLWALPYPRDLVLEVLGVDSSFQQIIADVSEAQIRALARDVLRYALSGNFTTSETAVRTGHEWDGQGWADIDGEAGKFAFVFEMLYAETNDPVAHQAGMGNNQIAGEVYYCIAVQGTEVA